MAIPHCDFRSPYVCSAQTSMGWGRMTAQAPYRLEPRASLLVVDEGGALIQLRGRASVADGPDPALPGSLRVVEIALTEVPCCAAKSFFITPGLELVYGESRMKINTQGCVTATSPPVARWCASAARCASTSVSRRRRRRTGHPPMRRRGMCSRWFLPSSRPRTSRQSLPGLWVLAVLALERMG